MSTSLKGDGGIISFTLSRGGSKKGGVLGVRPAALLGTPKLHKEGKKHCAQIRRVLVLNSNLDPPPPPPFQNLPKCLEGVGGGGQLERFQRGFPMLQPSSPHNNDRSLKDMDGEHGAKIGPLRALLCL